MKIVQGIDRLPSDRRLAVTVGIFDGVHRGHQQVLEVLRRTAHRLEAMPAAVTFDPHPDAVIHGAAPDLIMDRTERFERLAGLGVEIVAVQRFDEAFRRTPAEEFMRRLGGGRNLAALVMTALSAFGHRRAGTLPMLEEMGRRLGWEVVEASSVNVRGDRVSSARIRDLIGSGRILSAGLLLGHAYGIVGEVVHGEQRGRELGFPTANLHFPDLLCLPPDGIYAAHASWGGEAILAPLERAEAVVSLGSQPTFGGHVRVLEVHLLDREVDLYGERLRVEICRRLRGQERYDSVDELIEQMGRDVERTRKVLADAT